MCLAVCTTIFAFCTLFFALCTLFCFVYTILLCVHNFLATMSCVLPCTVMTDLNSLQLMVSANTPQSNDLSAQYVKCFQISVHVFRVDILYFWALLNLGQLVKSEQSRYLPKVSEMMPVQEENFPIIVGNCSTLQIVKLFEWPNHRMSHYFQKTVLTRGLYRIPLTLIHLRWRLSKNKTKKAGTRKRVKTHPCALAPDML